MKSKTIVAERKSAGVLVGVAMLAGWVVLGAEGFRWIEGWGWIDAIYMTIITISTVGFREVHPLSQVGRLWASFVIVAGIGTGVYTFTRLGQLVLEGELLDILGRRKMKSELERLRDHFIICGYGRIGRPVAEGIAHEGRPVCVVDHSEHVERELQQRKLKLPFVVGDATEDATLEAAGLQYATALLALLPSDADNLYLTITAKSVNPAIKPAVMEFMELVTPRQHLPLRLEEVRVSSGSVLDGRSLAEAQIRKDYGVIVVAIKRQDGEMLFNPDPGVSITAGDMVVAMGQEDALGKLSGACG